MEFDVCPSRDVFNSKLNPGIGEISGLELSTAHRHTIVFASFSGRSTVARIMASISPACYLREQQPNNLTFVSDWKASVSNDYIVK